jgi:hypothetical protein
MAMISESERRDGETAFPSLGTILAAMNEAMEIFPVFSKGFDKVNDAPVFAQQEPKRLK